MISVNSASFFAGAGAEKVFIDEIFNLIIYKTTKYINKLYLKSDLITFFIKMLFS